MTAPALPVVGERYKRHEFTREVLAADLFSVTYRIQLGSKAETHVVSAGTWNRWAEKARKVDS